MAVMQLMTAIVATYAPKAEIRFMIKLLTDLWCECTICAVFFSMSLMVSIMYLLRSIILS